MSSGSESEVRTYFGKNTLFGEKNMFWGVYFLFTGLHFRCNCVRARRTYTSVHRTTHFGIFNSTTVSSLNCGLSIEENRLRNIVANSTQQSPLKHEKK